MLRHDPPRRAFAVTLVASLFCVPFTFSASPSASRVEQAGLSSLKFIQYVGQMDEQMAYCEPMFAGMSYITRDGKIVYALPARSSTGGDTREDIVPEDAASNATWVLTESFVGGQAQPVGRDLSEGRVSYFIGSDPGKWKTGVRTYEHVDLGEVWPGIDVSVRASRDAAEKIFTVHPGASVSAIRLQYHGANEIGKDDTGALEIGTPSRRLVFSAPIDISKCS